MDSNVKKAIGVFFLGIFTFGISNLVFIYIISNKVSFFDNGRVIYPVRELVLSIVTCGIYTCFWGYKMSCKINKTVGDCKAMTNAVLCMPMLRSIGVSRIYSKANAA